MEEYKYLVTYFRKYDEVVQTIKFKTKEEVKKFTKEKVTIVNIYEIKTVTNEFIKK